MVQPISRWYETDAKDQMIFQLNPERIPIERSKLENEPETNNNRTR